VLNAKKYPVVNHDRSYTDLMQSTAVDRRHIVGILSNITL